uniref:Uncharacterized protein n=1 Tax=Rheinheimera sp. BAL341 TaxID=1708203 RepID=A0A486XWY7_9GAMM
MRPAAGKTLSLMAALKRDAKQVNNANCYQCYIIELKHYFAIFYLVIYTVFEYF